MRTRGFLQDPGICHGQEHAQRRSHLRRYVCCVRLLHNNYISPLHALRKALIDPTLLLILWTSLVLSLYIYDCYYCYLTTIRRSIDAHQLILINYYKQYSTFIVIIILSLQSRWTPYLSIEQHSSSIPISPSFQHSLVKN
jgi:hypothetical protein